MNFRQIAEAVMGASSADETEVLAMEQNESLTRFANNYIHQNVTERNVQITVRSVIGTKIGIAVSNDVRPASLHELTVRACDVAKLQPENPEFKGLASPQRITPVEAFDGAVAECTPEQRAASVGIICRNAADRGCSAAGSMTTSSLNTGVANSKGVLAEHRFTLVDQSTVIMGNNSSGWAQRTGWRLAAIEAESLAEEALAKVRMGADPIDFEPGEYPVILDSYATADLLEMLGYDGMGALAVQEGRSWMNGRIGQRIMADSVNIIDDGTNIAGIPWPFDFEGLPKKVCRTLPPASRWSPFLHPSRSGGKVEKQRPGKARPPI